MQMQTTVCAGLSPQHSSDALWLNTKRYVILPVLHKHSYTSGQLKGDADTRVNSYADTGAFARADGDATAVIYAVRHACAAAGAVNHACAAVKVGCRRGMHNR